MRKTTGTAPPFSWPSAARPRPGQPQKRGDGDDHHDWYGIGSHHRASKRGLPMAATPPRRRLHDCGREYSICLDAVRPGNPKDVRLVETVDSDGVHDFHHRANLADAA